MKLFKEARAKYYGWRAGKQIKHATLMAQIAKEFRLPKNRKDPRNLAFAKQFSAARLRYLQRSKQFRSRAQGHKAAITSNWGHRGVG